MNTTTKRNALDIESALLNGIAVHGPDKVAKVIGVDKSQLTRWKQTWIPKLARLLAAIEWGVMDDEIARIAKQVGEMLINEKRPNATNI